MHNTNNIHNYNNNKTEAQRNYYKEIVVKSANSRAHVAGSINCSSNSNIKSISSSNNCHSNSNCSNRSAAVSFVDKFADFITLNRRKMPSNSKSASEVHNKHTNNSNAVSFLIPNSNNNSNGNNTNANATTTSNNNNNNNSSSGNSNNVTNNNNVSSISNGIKTTIGKKTPVILLAARAGGVGNKSQLQQHPSLSLINGSQTSTSGKAAVTLVRVNPNANRSRQVIITPETSSLQQQQQQQQQQPPQQQLIEEPEEEELIDEDVYDDDGATLNAALSSSTAQILRKFRIPKGTALTAKAADSYLAMPTPTPSPPGGVGVPATGTVSLDAATYVDNTDDIIEELNEDDLVEEVIDEEGGCEEQQVLLHHQTAGDSDGLDLSSSSNSNHNAEATVAAVTPAATNAAATLLLQHQQQQQQQQPAALQLQTVGPNGTVTCFNLPPNTILVQSSDGSIIAHPSKAGQQQLIVLPADWPTTNVALAEPTAAAAPPAPQAPQTQTLLLTADGTAIPIMAPLQQQQPQQQQQAAAVAAAAQLFAA